MHVGKRLNNLDEVIYLDYAVTYYYAYNLNKLVFEFRINKLNFVVDVLI